MKRLVLAVATLAAVAVLAWPISQGVRTASGVCAEMTPAKMLENPALAWEYAQALRSGESGAVDRIEALFGEIRAAHGCVGAVTLPRHAPAAQLPPGHPPIDRAPAQPSAPVVPVVPFEAPLTVTI